MLEADFQETYRVDLSDLFRGRLTMRRCLVLLKGLPSSSRFSAALMGPQWGTAEQLLAIVADRVAENTWARAQSMSKSMIPRPEPIPRPRPKGEAPKPRVLTGAELADWMGAAP